MEEKTNPDVLVRCLAGNGQVIASAVTSREVAETSRRLHETSPIATAALGRLLTAGLLMGDLLRNPTDALTLVVKGDGPIGEILVTSDNSGAVKGYCANSKVYLPNEANGHLNVAGAVGKGTLTVIKDQGMKDNYNSTVPLHSGEIADDLVYYYAQSEQIPTAMGLGVLVNPDESVAQAGGFLLQLMPGATGPVIDRLEENRKKIQGVTDLLKEGKTPEGILDLLLEGLDHTPTERKSVRFHCDCNRERGMLILKSLGKKELLSLIDEKKPVEMTCGFCGKKYVYSLAEIEELASSLSDPKD